MHRGDRRRVVINISFGYIAGPHDGSGLLEIASWSSSSS